MSLNKPYDDANIFARILREEIPCAKLFEDEHVLAFMDAFPQAEGHTLIVPKHGQARNLLDVPQETLSQTIKRVQWVAQAVEAALKPDGIIINQFNGHAAGQTVFHLHFHVIPCYLERPASPHGEGGGANMTALQNTAQMIALAAPKDIPGFFIETL